MNNTHRMKINTRQGIFELDGVPIMQQTLSCTIRYQGNAPSVVELTLLADLELEDDFEVQCAKRKDLPLCRTTRSGGSDS